MKHRNQLKSQTSARVTESDSRRTPWFLLGALCSIAIGLSGCASTSGEGDEAPMTNAYGDPDGSPAAQQMAMEEQMQEVTQSLIR